MKSVLIVDESSFMMCNLKRYMLESGFEVVGEANTILSAIDMYEELRPDILAIDISMPYFSGIDAIEKIKRNDQNARIIVSSTFTQEWLIRRALKAGAFAFIVKPANFIC